MKRTRYQVLLKEALYIADKAATLLKEYQKKVRTISFKDKVDLVTSADLASEKLIINLIHQKYPTHGIYSEEAKDVYKGEYSWIIDPLDQTKEYSRGLSEYNCLIAIEHKRQLKVGVIKRVGINEVYSCASEFGAFLNGQKISVSNTTALDKSFIGIHLPTSTTPISQIDSMLRLTRNLIMSTYRLRPGWDDAKILGWVAQGVLEAHIITSGIKNGWYDLASGILLVEEAGGVVTNLQGEPIKNRDLSRGIVASNGKIHEELLSLIRDSGSSPE